MVTRRCVVVVLAAALLPAGARAQSLERVPDSIQGELRQELLANRARVEARIDDFNRRATSFNSRCQGLPATHPNAAACQREGASLSQEATFIERDKTVYNASVNSATAAHNDAMVVDTRGLEVAVMDLVNQVPQLRGSPGATPMAKGFQALIADSPYEVAVPVT